MRFSPNRSPSEPATRSSKLGVSGAFEIHCSPASPPPSLANRRQATLTAVESTDTTAVPMIAAR